MRKRPYESVAVWLLVGIITLALSPAFGADPFAISNAPKATPVIDGDVSEWASFGADVLRMSWAHNQRSAADSDPWSSVFYGSNSGLQTTPPPPTSIVIGDSSTMTWEPWSGSGLSIGNGTSLVGGPALDFGTDCLNGAPHTAFKIKADQNR